MRAALLSTLAAVTLSTVSASAWATDLPKRVGGGLADFRNDRKVVALIKKAEKCPWSSSGYAYGCPELRALMKAPEVQHGKADVTFVNLLGDEKVELRHLAAEVLAAHGQFGANKELAPRVVAAGVQEVGPAVGSGLGRAIAKVDPRVGVDEHILELARSHALPELRAGLVGGMLWTAPRERYDLVLSLAKGDKEKRVRQRALGALFLGTPAERRPDSCAAWLSATADADADLASEGFVNLTMWSDGKCRDQYDAVLARLEERAGGGQVTRSGMGRALKYLHAQAAATAPQKKRAVEAAKKIVTAKANDSFARRTALELVLLAEPAAGQALAKELVDDPDAAVRALARKSGTTSNNQLSARAADGEPHHRRHDRVLPCDRQATDGEHRRLPPRLGAARDPGPRREEPLIAVTRDAAFITNLTFVREVCVRAHRPLEGRIGEDGGAREGAWPEAASHAGRVIGRAGGELERQARLDERGAEPSARVAEPRALPRAEPRRRRRRAGGAPARRGGAGGPHGAADHEQGQPAWHVRRQRGQLVSEAQRQVAEDRLVSTLGARRERGPRDLARDGHLGR